MICVKFHKQNLKLYFEKFLKTFKNLGSFEAKFQYICTQVMALVGLVCLSGVMVRVLDLRSRDR